MSKTIDPKQQRAIQSKNCILNAAKQVFAQKGPHGARVDEIAQKSGVNKQRIYAYFGSKTQLYRQVLLSIYAQASENKKLAQIDENDIKNLTQIIMEAFFEFHEHNPLFWRLLSWENLNGGKTLSESDWHNIQSEYINKLKHFYNLGQQKGFFNKEVDFSSYIISIFAATYFYHSNQLTISHLLNIKLNTQNSKANYQSQLLKIFRKGIRV